MCHYITATMAPDGDESMVRRLANKAHLKWEPLENPSVIQHLRSGERYFLTTPGMCDCGTALGARIRVQGTLPPRDSDLSGTIKNLKKKGWSASKIDRWVEQLKAYVNRKHEETAARLNCKHEIERWIEFVSAVLEGKHAQWIGIMVHWYGGNLETASIAAGSRCWLPLSDLTDDYLLNLAEDTLHTFTL
jgi:hypothetical protein